MNPTPTNSEQNVTEKMGGKGDHLVKSDRTKKKTAIKKSTPTGGGHTRNKQTVRCQGKGTEEKLVNCSLVKKGGLLEQGDNNESKTPHQGKITTQEQLTGLDAKECSGGRQSRGRNTKRIRKENTVIKRKMRSKKKKTQSDSNADEEVKKGGLEDREGKKKTGRM